MRARGDAFSNAYERIDASSPLYDSDGGGFHASTVLSAVRFCANDIA